MRPKVYSLILAVTMMTIVPQAVMAQGVKKDKWVEAVYPGGEWLLPLVEDKVVQIRLTVNRYNIPASLPDHTPGWGDIELSDVDLDVEGQLGAPMQIGDVYYFDITSKKGSGRIGIRKFRNNPNDDPYVKIMDVSGAIAKWVKKDSKLRPYQGNGRMYNPTIYAMTEKELDNILKRCNNENYIDYNWWMKNRNGFSFTTVASSAGNNRGNTTPSPQGTVSLKGLMKASGLKPQQGQPVRSKPKASASGMRMKFLGLELGTDAKKFGQALRSRGFTEGNGFSSNPEDIFLEGVVYEKIYTENMKCSQISQVSIYVENGLVKEVTSVDYVSSESAAKKRWNVYRKHIISEYGQGKITYENHYEVDLPYGTVSCEYGAFDSGDCEVIMKISMK